MQVKHILMQLLDSISLLVVFFILFIYLYKLSGLIKVKSCRYLLYMIKTLSGAKRRVISEVTGEQQKSDRELKKACYRSLEGVKIKPRFM